MFRRRRRSFGSGSLGRSTRPFQKPGGRLSPAIALGILLVSLISLELLLRAIATFRGINSEVSTYQGEPPSITAYRLQFTGADRQPYDGLASGGQLKATRSPLMGYELLVDQQNPFWHINEQGFRDDAPLPLAKPQGEIRIFVLGGSTAFGQLSSNNQATFAHRLEVLLNERVAAQTQRADQFQPAVLPYRKDLSDLALALPPRIPEGSYRVINAAVPGYASGNELGQLAHRILAYSPDLIIVLNGYTDLMLPSNYEAAEIPNLEFMLSNSGRHLTAHMSQQFQGVFEQAYLVKAFQYLVLQPRQNPVSLKLVTPAAEHSLEQQITVDPAELEGRISRYRSNLQEMARLTASARIPLIVAIQPEITGRQALTEQESEILEAVGEGYQERIQQGYTTLADAASQVRKGFPQTMKALNLRTLYASEPSGQSAFTSPVHLTDSANEILANRLYQAIIEINAIAPVPFNQAQ